MSGTIGSVSAAAVPDRELAVLCDVDEGAGTMTAFLRRYSVDAAGQVTATDTALDGVTAYAPAGTVTVCREPAGGPAAPHGTQSTPWDLAAAPGTLSVTLVVYSGTVTVVTADGSLDVPEGTTLTWGSQQSSEPLEGTLTIGQDATAGAVWQVIWTAR